MEKSMDTVFKGDHSISITTKFGPILPSGSWEEDPYVKGLQIQSDGKS